MRAATWIFAMLLAVFALTEAFPFSEEMEQGELSESYGSEEDNEVGVFDMETFASSNDDSSTRRSRKGKGKKSGKGKSKRRGQAKTESPNASA